MGREPRGGRRAAAHARPVSHTLHTHSAARREPFSQRRDLSPVTPPRRQPMGRHSDCLAGGAGAAARRRYGATRAPSRPVPPRPMPSRGRAAPRGAACCPRGRTGRTGVLPASPPPKAILRRPRKAHPLAVPPLRPAAGAADRETFLGEKLNIYIYIYSFPPALCLSSPAVR